MAIRKLFLLARQSPGHWCQLFRVDGRSSNTTKVGINSSTKFSSCEPFRTRRLPGFAFTVAVKRQVRSSIYIERERYIERESEIEREKKMRIYMCMLYICEEP